MRRPGGYAQIFNTGRPHVARFDDAGEAGHSQLVCEGISELDTFTCPHCNGVAHVPAVNRDTDYYFCRNCMARICPKCADFECTPFLKRLEKQEARERALKSYGVL